MSKKTLQWEPEAEKRLKKAPFFIRNIARKKLEKAAMEMGESTITVELLEQIKAKEMQQG